MNIQRSMEIIGKFLDWALENIHDEDALQRLLCEQVGMTQDELHEFSIDSMDEYFDLTGGLKL